MKRKMLTLILATVLMMSTVPAKAEDAVLQNAGLDALDGWTVAEGSGAVSVDSDTKAEGAGALKIANAEGQTTKVSQSFARPASFTAVHMYIRLQLKVVSAAGNGARVEVRDSTGNLSRRAYDKEAQSGYITTTRGNFINIDLMPYWSGKELYTLSLILEGAGEVYFDAVTIKDLPYWANTDFEGFQSYSDTGYTLGGGWTTEGDSVRLDSDETQGQYVYLEDTSDYLYGLYAVKLTPGKVYRIHWKYKAIAAYYLSVTLYLSQSYSASGGLSGNTWSWGVKSPDNGASWGDGSYIFTLPEGYWGAALTFRGRTGGLSVDDIILEEVKNTEVTFEKGDGGSATVTTAMSASAEEEAFFLIGVYKNNGAARVLTDVRVVSLTLAASTALGTISVAYIGEVSETFTLSAGETVEVMRWDSVSGLQPIMDKVTFE